MFNCFTGKTLKGKGLSQERAPTWNACSCLHFPAKYLMQASFTLLRMQSLGGWCFTKYGWYSAGATGGDSLFFFQNMLTQGFLSGHYGGHTRFGMSRPLAPARFSFAIPAEVIWVLVLVIWMS